MNRSVDPPRTHDDDGHQLVVYPEDRPIIIRLSLPRELSGNAVLHGFKAALEAFNDTIAGMQGSARQANRNATKDEDAHRQLVTRTRVETFEAVAAHFREGLARCLDVEDQLMVSETVAEIEVQEALSRPTGDEHPELPLKELQLWQANDLLFGIVSFRNGLRTSAGELLEVAACTADEDLGYRLRFAHQAQAYATTADLLDRNLITFFGKGVEYEEYVKEHGTCRGDVTMPSDLQKVRVLPGEGKAS